MPFVPKVVSDKSGAINSQSDTYVSVGTDAINSASRRALRWLEQLQQQPVDEQKEAVRIFIKKLWAVELISEAHYYDLQELLDDDYEPDQNHRPGREKSFYIVVYASRKDGELYSQGFNVMATNATDAYVALSKRSTYRFMTDISLVTVFSGKEEDAEGEIPIRTFAKDELIFV